MGIESMGATESEPIVWTRKDVALFLRVPVRSTYSMTRARAKDSGNAIPSLRLPGCGLRFLKADVLSWVEKSRTN
jgi:hypothetical protein